MYWTIACLNMRWHSQYVQCQFSPSQPEHTRRKLFNHKIFCDVAVFLPWEQAVLPFQSTCVLFALLTSSNLTIREIGHLTRPLHSPGDCNVDGLVSFSFWSLLLSGQRPWDNILFLSDLVICTKEFLSHWEVSVGDQKLNRRDRTLLHSALFHSEMFLPRTKIFAGYAIAVFSTLMISPSSACIFFFSCIAGRVRDTVGQLLEIRVELKTN